MAVANGEVSWQPPVALAQFERDLQFLPLLFAESNDVLVCSQQPSDEFFNSIDWLPGRSCSFEAIEHLNQLSDKNSLNVDRLNPWGWSPAVHHRLRKLKSNTSQSFQDSAMYSWTEKHKELYSRGSALKVLKTILQLGGEMQPIIHKGLLPRVARTIEDVEKLFLEWNQLVLKSPWSSSGRGVQILRYGYLNTSNRQWIASVLKQQGYLMVEPLLKKQHDFSLHFHISRNGIRSLGLGSFSTNSNGRYIANDIFPDAKLIDDIIPISDLQHMLEYALLENGVQNFYEGYAGVDLMVVDINGHSVIQPCVEINWRYNMGLVALRLQKLLTGTRKGYFSVFVSPNETFDSFCERMKVLYEPKKHNGLPVSGFFPLTEFVDSQSGGYMVLGEGMPQ